MPTKANQLSGADWLKNSFSIWRGIPKDSIGRTRHPAAFPVSLIEKILDCYAPGKESLILDPFVGSGSTLIAATNKGMPSIGLDVNAAFREVFMNRLDLFNGQENGKCHLWRYEVCDARDYECFSEIVAPDSVDLCVTSPPYWDILSRKRTCDKKEAITYSDSDTDIGNLASYDVFLKALGDVFENVAMVLKKRGYFILSVMDVRKKDRFYPLHQDAANVVQERAGLVLEDIIVWDRQNDYNAMRPLGYPYKFIINKVHEYLLVFRKK